MGMNIQASWLDWEGNTIQAAGGEPTADQWASHWSGCISEAAAADILLFVALEHETQCGALLEVGAALGAGRSVYLISPYEWSFENHPNVRRFATLKDAIGELIKRGVPDTRAAFIAPQRASLRACSVVVALVTAFCALSLLLLQLPPIDN